MTRAARAHAYALHQFQALKRGHRRRRSAWKRLRDATTALLRSELRRKR